MISRNFFFFKTFSDRSIKTLKPNFLYLLASFLTLFLFIYLFLQFVPLRSYKLKLYNQHQGAARNSLHLQCKLNLVRTFVCIENTFVVSERYAVHMELERALLMCVVDSMLFELILKHWVGGALKILAKMM